MKVWVRAIDKQTSNIKEKRKQSQKKKDNLRGSTKLSYVHGQENT